jgi:hypothetical protein
MAKIILLFPDTVNFRAPVPVVFSRPAAVARHAMGKLSSLLCGETVFFVPANPDCSP